MVDVSAETNVFSKKTDGRAVVLLLARRIPNSGAAWPSVAGTIERTVSGWRSQGWYTALGDMFGDTSEPMVYETGFAHDIDVAAVFEAPTVAAAYDGISELQDSGWNVLFDTEWSVGVREFQPVVSRIGRNAQSPWALFALWEWNDEWQAASPAQRKAYDLECDEAFTADVDSGVSIAGRHRLDAQSPWHHLGLWEAPTFEHITRGMFMHETVADFKFTTSRHFVGRRRGLADYLGAQS